MHLSGHWDWKDKQTEVRVNTYLCIAFNNNKCILKSRSIVEWVLYDEIDYYSHEDEQLRPFQQVVPSL